MIFTPRLARAILRGAKTETRRTIRPGETTSRYRPGDTHPIQPERGAPATGRITITSVTRQPLGDITQADARAEGFDGRDPRAAFIRQWVRIMDPSWRHGIDADLITPAEIHDRWYQHHAHRDVWVVRFSLDRTAEPRLLALHSERGYVTRPQQALPDEPEAIDRMTQHAISRTADQVNDQVRDQRRATIQDRLDRQAEAIAAVLSQMERDAARAGITNRRHYRTAAHLLARTRRTPETTQ